MKDRIVRFLLGFILICLIVIIALPDYTKKKLGVQDKIGEIWSGGAISSKDYLTITKCYNYYLDLIKNGKNEEAYKLLSFNYRHYKTYDEFLLDILDIDYSNAVIADVKPLTTQLYEIDLDNEISNLILFSDSGFSIIPERLIEYMDRDVTIDKKNVTYQIVSTKNMVDSYVVDVVLKNEDKRNSINISGIYLCLEDGINKKGNPSTIILEPGEILETSISFDTCLDFPTKIMFVRTFKNGKDVEYYLDL